MGQPFELGQLGNYISVNDYELTVGIGTSVSVTGTLTAETFVGDGSNLTGTGIVVSTRNGFAGVNSTGDEVTNVTSLRFDSNSGLAVTSLGPGEAFVNFGSSFNPYTVQGQDSLDATGEEELEIIAGSGIEITTDANSTPKSITFTNNATTIDYADNAGISTNVIGGISSVTELYSSGISTLAANGGITTTGGSLFTKQLSVSGVVTATSFYGDGSGLENTGAIVSAGSGSQRLVLTDITSGIMTSAATDSALTYDSATGTLSATAFSGDGSGLENTGAIVSAGSGSQRLVLTDITSGIMTSTATDSALTYDSATGTLSATTFSGDGSGLENTGAVVSAGSGSQRIVLTDVTSGIMTGAATDSALTYDSATGTLSATAFSGDGSGLSNTGATLDVASGTQRVVLTSGTTGIMTGAATDSTLTYDSATGTLNATVGLAEYSAEWTLGADAGNSYYTFTGPGYDGTEQNPHIFLVRGNKYKITNTMGAHPIRIQTSRGPNGGNRSQYNVGLSANDVDDGTIEWDVQWDTPTHLFYQCTAHSAMGGKIFIHDPSYEESGTSSVIAKSYSPYSYFYEDVCGVVPDEVNPRLSPKSDNNGNVGYAFTTYGGLKTNGPMWTKDEQIVLGISTYYDTSGNVVYKFGVGNDQYWNRITIGSPRANSYDASQNRGPRDNYCFGVNIPETVGASCLNNIAIGRRTIRSSNCSNNVILTLDGPAGNTSVYNNVVIGNDANRFGGLGLYGYGAGSGLVDAVVIGNRAASGCVSIHTSVAVGSEAMQNGHSSASANANITHHVAIGYRAGYSLRSQSACTAVGSNALKNNTSGSGQNTSIGYNTASSLTSGTNNTCIGYQADVTASNVTNEITLGNASVATLRCQVTSITALSDRRDKTNIEDIPVGLNYINALRPVKFDWARRDGSYEGKKSFGFIAQELNQVQEQFGYKDYTNLVYESNPEKLEASPMNTYPVLIKAVQELSQQNQELLKRIEDLENRLNGG